MIRKAGHTPTAATLVHRVLGTPGQSRTYTPATAAIIAACFSILTALHL